jgi:uncharacterized protein
MKRVFIVHGWGGSPNEEIHKWMNKELKSRGFDVHALTMPNTEEPKIDDWVSFLKEQASSPDENTFFIGHSVGCQTILRYLETLQEKIKIGGVVLIAPWVNLLETAYENPREEKKIAEPWIATPIDWDKIKTHTDNFIAIFSDNDFCVPLSNKDIFKEKLGAKIIIEHEQGHFTEETNITKVPSALNLVLEMSNTTK